ncbi:hypothetical protein GCM10027098_14040 [Bowmanella dokdonensis]
MPGEGDYGEGHSELTFGHSVNIHWIVTESYFYTVSRHSKQGRYLGSFWHSNKALQIQGFVQY